MKKDEWEGGVLIGKSIELKNHDSISMEAYQFETGSVIWVKNPNLEIIKKPCAEIFERIQFIFNIDKESAYVSTSMYKKPLNWEERLYYVSSNGWSNPLIISKLKGFLKNNNEIWFISKKGNIFRILINELKQIANPR
ncbi:MAG: hypothetical protein HY934_04520 [Candidatus Firestonebacteria bacterium]|nr:hypothetical protein [Candidatus Firestonebacteria bacterium]